jgi:transcriptional regulator with XRE-family HTH domain
MHESLVAMAERARCEPVFFGHRLERYAQAHRLEDDALAERLGVSLETLTDLRLCGSPHTAEDLATLHREFGASLQTLWAVCAEALEATCQASPRS